MELICYEVEPGRVEVRPAQRRRPWMDATAHQFAYRCLPLTIANTHGWEMLCPYAFEVVWTGGPERRDLVITPADAAQAAERPGLVDSHFANGIVTFAPNLVLRTPPGYNLFVSGPANSFKDGIQPLTAVVETDWMPYTFTMNWRMTRANTAVRFEQGEPFCQFFPLERGVVARTEPRLGSLDEDPELARSYQWAKARRELDTTFNESFAEQFQGWYAKGEQPRRDAGRGPADHETHLSPRNFKPRRP